MYTVVIIYNPLRHVDKRVMAMAINGQSSPMLGDIIRRLHASALKMLSSQHMVLISSFIWRYKQIKVNKHMVFSVHIWSITYLQV